MDPASQLIAAASRLPLGQKLFKVAAIPTEGAGLLGIAAEPRVWLACVFHLLATVLFAEPDTRRLAVSSLLLAAGVPLAATGLH